MDKSYYYRVLGAKEGASAQQIKQAYEERVKRLKSPDYADDPEYVARKLKEAAEAYRAVLGGSAPSAEKQRKKSYEKLKDSMEKGETSRSTKPRRTVRDASQNAATDVAAQVSATGKKLKKKADKTIGSVTDSKEAKSVLGVIISVIIAVVGLMGSFDSDDTYTYDDSAYIEENGQAIARIVNRSKNYDFYGHLDDSVTVPKEKIEWDINENDELLEEMWGLNQDLSYAMGINSLAYGIEAYTGSEDYYYDATDYDMSQLLIGIMGAPHFEDVAGMMNEYRNEIILDYGSYMRFLADVAEDQTDEICGEPVEYSY